MITNADLLIYAVIALTANIFGGIAGGGAGFVTTPLLIFLGLSPAQAVSSGKFTGLAVTLASLQRLRKEKLHSRKVIVPIMILAGVIGLIAPFAIAKLETEFYRNTLGVLLLAMIPIVLLKKVGQAKKEVSYRQKVIGWILLSFALLVQGIFSGGMGTLVSLVLMGMMGMSALEASVTKRFSQVLLNGIIIGVVFGGLVVWRVALVGIVCGYIGGLIGVNLAIKKGNKFVTYVFVVFMLFAALELLLG